jgi:hypothetical protein
MTKIIGFCGRKQAGKNTCCNAILSLKLCHAGICERSRLTDDGKIEVSDILGEKWPNKDFFPFDEQHVNLEQLFSGKNLFCKIYALADTLKDVCHQVLGLDLHLMNGSNEDKNTATEYRWENMPGVITWAQMRSLGISKEQAEEIGLFVHGAGKMTVRDVMQYVGSEVFRKMNPDIWSECLFRKLHEESPEMALISDVRFANEVDALIKNKALVIGLTRNPFPEDSHQSEKLVVQDHCKHIIFNNKMTIKDQTIELYKILRKAHAGFPVPDPKELV